MSGVRNRRTLSSVSAVPGVDQRSVGLVRTARHGGYTAVELSRVSRATWDRLAPEVVEVDHYEF